MTTVSQRQVLQILCTALTACLLMACARVDLTPAPQPTVAAGRTATLPSPTPVGQPLPTPTATISAPQPTAVPPAITTIAVTPDGAVWYAYGNLTWPTHGGGGVKRFVDGQTSSFGLADGLPHEHVQLLKVAPDGVLWADAERHLARFDGRAWETIACVGEHTRNIVLDLAVAPDGTVWAASPFALVGFDGQSCMALERMTRSVAFAPDGTLWVSGWEGGQDSWYVGSWNGSTWTTHNTIELFDESVSEVVVTADGRVCGATAYHGVVCFDGQEWTEYTTEDDLPSNRILDLALAPDGTLWALTDRGVARFDGQVWVEEHSAPPTARAMSIGPDGTIWFATAMGLEHTERRLAVPTVTPTTQEESELTAAQILSFKVTPQRIEAGDTVTLTWEARGDRATLCPTTRYVLFGSEDCQQVALSGTMAFSLPADLAGNPYIDFLLTVEAEGSAPAVGQVSVAVKCSTTWFFSTEPQAGICPREPVPSYAAAQRFERGMMVWLQELGRYYILPGDPLAAQGGQVQVVADPLEIVQDTAGQILPPQGLLAPVSGFGLVWRGDVVGSPGFRDELGWALEPELGYQAIWQCDDAVPSGGRSWQTCYLLGPDQRVIMFHPLGGWRLLEDEKQ